MKITLLAARLIFTLAALPTLLIFVLLLILQQNPLPPLDYPGFGACALPCWGGIVPDQTRTLDSPQVMAAQFGGAEFEFSQVGMQINFTVDLPDRRLEGVIYDDRGVVGSLRVMLRMPLWRLMEALGTPQCVSTQTYPDGGELVSLWWVNDNHTISSGVILPPPPDWNASVQVFTLAVFKDIERCHAPDAKPWQGFAPLWFYRINRSD